MPALTVHKFVVHCAVTSYDYQIDFTDSVTDSFGFLVLNIFLFCFSLIVSLLVISV